MKRHKMMTVYLHDDKTLVEYTRGWSELGVISRMDMRQDVISELNKLSDQLNKWIKAIKELKATAGKE